MSQPPPPEYALAPPADFVLPFHLPAARIRGRLVRLDRVSSRALAAHPLPEPAQRIVAEALALSAMLGSALRLTGRLSLQLKGDGPLNLLATDYFGGGGLRGYARLQDERFAQAGKPSQFGPLAGEGAFAITIMPKPGGETYQGLVAIEPNGLTACAETYFAQSEQLPTMLKLAAGPTYSLGAGHGWRAGGLMLQAVPGPDPGEVEPPEDWERMALFLQTLEDIELLDTELSAEQVLWRLFHDDEIRVHPSESLHFQCSCDAENIRSVLRSYSPAALHDLPDPDGTIRARCEFCGTVHEFPPEALAV